MFYARDEDNDADAVQLLKFSGGEIIRTGHRGRGPRGGGCRCDGGRRGGRFAGWWCRVGGRWCRRGLDVDVALVRYVDGQEIRAVNVAA